MVKADPDATLKGLEEPVLLDEWQEVPDVLGAVKRACDASPRPGRFILTGSAGGEVQTRSWPGTGRVTDIRMSPMTVGEMTSSTVPSLLDRIAAGALETLKATVFAEPELNVRNYIDFAMRSGFPHAALDLSGPSRRRWLNSYVKKIVTRTDGLANGRYDSRKLTRFFKAYALGSATTMSDTTLCESAAIDRQTAERYLDLLNRIYVVDELPAWSSNRLKRLTLAPKRLLVDAALIAAASGLTEDSVMRDSDFLGRMIETMVLTQLRAQAEASAHSVSLHHLRTKGGRQEVDAVAEIDGSAIVAVEVKATSSPRSEDTKHLAWLREQESDRFLAGVLLHTGPGAFRLSDRIWALPISSLWKPLPSADNHRGG